MQYLFQMKLATYSRPAAGKKESPDRTLRVPLAPHYKIFSDSAFLHITTPNSRDRFARDRASFHIGTPSRCRAS